MKKIKFYSFCEKKLEYERFSIARLAPLVLFVFLIGLLVGSIMARGPEKKVTSPEEYEELILLVDATENDLMSPKAMYEYMKEVGIKYPEIVWSQVVMETGFTSQISIENHNFFGMKRATARPNTQSGENLGHATYRNWKMAVLDYALWQASTGLWKARSEDQYFAYLAEHYAASPTYATKVKSIRDNFAYYLASYEKKFKHDKK